MAQAVSCRSKGETWVEGGTPRFFSSVIGPAICVMAALTAACACVAGDGKSAARTGSGHRPQPPGMGYQTPDLNIAGEDKAVLSNWTLSLLRCGSGACGAVGPAVTHLQDS